MGNHRRKCGLVCADETLVQEETAQSVCSGDHGSETFYTREKRKQQMPYAFELF